MGACSVQEGRLGYHGLRHAEGPVLAHGAALDLSTELDNYDSEDAVMTVMAMVMMMAAMTVMIRR